VIQMQSIIDIHQIQSIGIISVLKLPLLNTQGFPC
jgi:hypothetical protein